MEVNGPATLLMLLCWCIEAVSHRSASIHAVLYEDSVQVSFSTRCKPRCKQYSSGWRETGEGVQYSAVRGQKDRFAPGWLRVLYSYSTSPQYSAGRVTRTSYEVYEEKSRESFARVQYFTTCHPQRNQPKKKHG